MLNQNGSWYKRQLIKTGIDRVGANDKKSASDIASMARETCDTKISTGKPAIHWRVGTKNGNFRSEKNSKGMKHENFAKVREKTRRNGLRERGKNRERKTIES